MPAQPEWLRVQSPVGLAGPVVDRERGIIRGVKIAEAGKFKDGRGHFTLDSLRRGVEIVQAENKRGLKSRLQHATLSDDGVAKFLGRQTNNRIEGGVWLADLHFDRSAYSTPAGDLANYVMDRAESDPDSFGTSLVGQFEWFDSAGKKLTRGEMFDAQEDSPGETLWMPLRLHGSDVVDTGNATSSLLSDESCLPDAMVRNGCQMLDEFFAGQSREVVAQRCTRFLSRYLDHRFGEVSMTNEESTVQAIEPKDDHAAAVQPADSVSPAVPAAAPELAPKVDPAATQSGGPQTVDLEAIRREARVEAEARVNQICQLCRLARCPEKAAELIASGLSADAVRDHLDAAVAADAVLKPSVHTSQDLQPAVRKTPADQDRADYARYKEQLQSLGLSEDDYLQSCEISRNGGILPQPKPMVSFVAVD